MMELWVRRNPGPAYVGIYQGPRILCRNGPRGSSLTYSHRCSIIILFSDKPSLGFRILLQVATARGLELSWKMESILPACWCWVLLCRGHARP